MTTAIVWLRQDLRLKDNPALYHACKNHDRVLPLYILDDETPGEWRMGGASKWWLHHSLVALNTTLSVHNHRITLRKGLTKQVINQLVEELGPVDIYWNRCYEPYAITRDREIETWCVEKGIKVHSFNGSLLVEPWDIKPQTSDFYKVYTPFWKQLQKQYANETPLPMPEFKGNQPEVESDTLEEWGLLPTTPNWAEGLEQRWEVGEIAAEKKLLSFLENKVNDYTDNRNNPAEEGTSALSPHLHFGEISPRQVWYASRHYQHEKADEKQVEKYLSELLWREFSYHLLYHVDDLPAKNFKPEFDHFPWREDAEALKRWQKGQTGYPIVDAGMRELWHTGYMHNRVRMIAASFLIKDLLIHWKQGEKWFWDTLVDADLANNAASWQWVAGSGADAAPYFRIFNPVLQGKRFDPKGKYVRKWLPELAKLPDSVIHAPWEADRKTLEYAGVELGRDYPHPMVDHGKARDRALAAYGAIKKSAR